MKTPKLRDLEIDNEGTKKIREMAKSQKVKITINIDLKNLDKVKRLAEKNGASYQKLMNQLLERALKANEANDTDDRLERLEKEVEKLKKRVA